MNKELLRKYNYFQATLRRQRKSLESQQITVCQLDRLTEDAAKELIRDLAANNVRLTTNKEKIMSNLNEYNRLLGQRELLEGEIRYKQMQLSAVDDQLAAIAADHRARIEEDFNPSRPVPEPDPEVSEELLAELV